jgi:glutathione synthase/RimK-type ligase-like ATP-grasp enzyme
LETVFLVSSIDLIHADTESIYLEKELKKRGFKSTIVSWDDPTIQWGEATLSISRTTSTYFNNPEKFIEWARKVEETSTLWNSSPVMEWNYHKRYLIQLQKYGIPMPETILIPKDTEKSMDSILELIPWDDFIMKPCIGAGSGGLQRFSKDSTDLEAHFRNLNRNGFKQVFNFGELEFIPCDTLVQPFIPEIIMNGEASLIFFGGKYSHSMIKKVKTGDFRAHPIWGAEVYRYYPSEEEIDVALQSLEVVGHSTEYARIDMIPTSSDPLIIEVELIDPNLFFDHLPETVKSFADHIENFIKKP